jgi:uncharacterized protein YukE
MKMSHHTKSDLIFKRLEEERECLYQIAEGRFIFRSSIPISKQSVYGDDVWNWVDPSNPRLALYHPTYLKLDWAALKSKYDMTAEIIGDLKKYTFFRYAHSSSAYPETKKNAHPHNLCREVIELTKFLSHLRKQLSSEGYSLINKLSDIQIEDLRSALSTYQGKSIKYVKKAIKCLGSRILGQHLNCGALNWNALDVNTLGWNSKASHSYERIPEGAFRLLSNSATADVKHFLHAMGIKTQDSTKIGENENLYLSAYKNFKKLFKGYMTARNALREEREGKGHRKYQSWFQSIAHSVRQISVLVDRARTAAQVIITLYTGARLSELTSLEGLSAPKGR